MKKLGIGSRLLAALLALTMVVSMLPISALAADGDIRDGVTGLDSNIDTLDTISWPIKVYDYLNDGLLFEYASAQDSSMTNLGGDAYGGGTKMPGDFTRYGKILGSDFTVNSSETTEYYDSNSYSYWLWKKSNYDVTYAQQGKDTAGAFKFLRLQPWLKCDDMPAIVISDFTNDAAKYAGGATSYPRDRVRYAVLVYKTNVPNMELTMGMSSNLNGDYTIRDYNGVYTTGPDGYYVDFNLVTSKYLTKSDQWNYVIVDMNSGPNGNVWDSITHATQIILDTNMTTPDDPDTPEVEQYLDLSHIAYFSDAEEAARFGEAAKAFSNNPGEYLPDQTYTVNGTTYSKHWNMGNNAAFTMLYASDGGGWNATEGKGGENSWANGYFSYQIGYNTSGASAVSNTYRNKAKEYGLPVADDIYFFNGYSTSKYLNDYDFGYKLFNYMSTGVMTAGLLEHELVDVVAADGTSYRIPKYKQATIDYIAVLLRNSLTIGRKDVYGNYNFNFVQGSPSSQFMVNGQKVDLATALRTALGLVPAANNCGNYTIPASADGNSAATNAKAHLLIGDYADVKDNIKTFHDAAYYLLHNLFVDDSYNQLQDDYNYLVLSKAPVTGTGKEAFVFDAGFTTGNYESDNSSTSAIVYNKTNGTISLNSAIGKDEICYNTNQWTTRNPFLPVTDATGDYGFNGTPYFREDGARTYADFGDTYVKRNYNYVMQANAEFIYHYQDDLFFQFEGDDDVYLFVNGELVLDIGAAHSITKVKMAMNDYVLTAQEKLAPFKQYHGYRAGMSDEKFEEVLNKAVAAGTIQASQKDEYRRWHHLNLVDGKSYPIDFYYMERHGWGANMRVATNIVMTDPAMVTEKKAYQDGAEISYGGIVDEEKLIEYSFSVTNKSFNKLYNINFNDYDIGVSLTPEKGLSFQKEGINGVTVTDARGQTLEASDLVVTVTGYRDANKTQPVSLNVRFDGQDPNGELKRFLTDLYSNDGTDNKESDDLFSGLGLWRYATLTVRGIYYTMTEEQIEEEIFNNAVFTTANPAVDSEIVLNSEDTHQVRLIGEALHIYQWEEHGVYFTREDVTEWVGGTLEVGGESYDADDILLITCRKDGTTYDYPDILVTDGTDMTVNYWDPGTHLTFIKVLRDTNHDGVPDDIDGNGVLDEYDYLTVLPLAVYVTNLMDDVVVLDYGLKAELTGKNGITANDYITVPNLPITYSIMGMSQTAPSYLDFDNPQANYSSDDLNRISFDPVTGNSIAFNDGTYTYSQETGDDKLFFTPTQFMDEHYVIYLAVTLHEDDFTASAVGTANGSANADYSIDITKEVQMYQKITVLPASVMYYENDFSGLNFVNPGDSLIGSSSSWYQGVDQSVNYGADHVYQTADNAQMSGNTMHKVPVTEYGTLASFTFRGTGFEVISRTNANDSASLVVTVKKDGKVVRRLPVITEFTNNGDTCAHTNHDTFGNCKVCGIYVGHVYYQNKCIKCETMRLDYYLVGNINGANYGCEEDYQNLGQYKFQNGKLTASFNTDSYVFVKTGGNDKWFMTDGYPGVGTHSSFLYDTETGINADKLHVPGGVEVTFHLVENDDGSLTLSYTTANDDLTDATKTVYFNNLGDATDDNPANDPWNQVYVYYWSDNNVTMCNWPGKQMTPVAEGSSEYALTLPADAQYVIFTNGEGKQTGDLTVPGVNKIYSYNGFHTGWATYYPGQTTVSFDNTRSNWSNVYVYYWSDTNETMIPWPGQPMVSDGGSLYSAGIPADADRMIFNDGTGAQTADLELQTNLDIYVYGGGWASMGEDAVADTTVYFRNTDGWDFVNVYYWDATSGGNLSSWPGVKMTLVEDDIYSAVISGEATHVKFNCATGPNDETSPRTGDVELPEDHNLYVYGASTVTEGWATYTPGESVTLPAYRTVYLVSDKGWTSNYAYFWADGNSTLSTWPGVPMVPVAGKTNLYKVLVPAAAEKIIFNIGSDANKTADLTLTNGVDMYTLSSNSWSSSGIAGSGGRMVYFDNYNGWTDVCIHFWSDSNSNMSKWPGVPMTLVEGTTYAAMIPEEAGYVIFNNGNNGAQTADLTLSADKNFYDYAVNSSSTWDDYTPVQILKLVNDKGWSNVYAYYWSYGDTSMTTWPGVPMTKGEDGTYTVRVPMEAEKIIFCDYDTATETTLAQTDNLDILPGYTTYTLSSLTWTGARRTVYFENTYGWTTVSAYYWSDTDKNMVGAEGTPMTLVSGNWYSCSIPAEAKYVKFLGDGEASTEETIIPDDQNMYTANGWQFYDPHAQYITNVYFRNENNWEKVHIYYWSADNAGMTGWMDNTMTHMGDDLYIFQLPAEAEYVIFHDGSGQQTDDLELPLDSNLFIINKEPSNGKFLGKWDVYEAEPDYAIHQVPVIRVGNLELGEYTVEIAGVPTYTDDVDWSKKEDYLKDTYMYLDGIRIFQPLGPNDQYYNATENDAVIEEIRGLILDGKAAVAVYDKTDTTTYSGNMSWSENRNGKESNLKDEYVGNQLSSVNEYMLMGPNNETYINGNAQTQAVIFYVKETDADVHSLQIGVRGIDEGLFLSGNATGIEASLYQGVQVYGGCGWIPVDTVLSSTEQYYTIDYAACPYTEADGVRIYQVALHVRSGMLSFTNLKLKGLEIASSGINYRTCYYYAADGSIQARHVGNATIQNPTATEHGSERFVCDYCGHVNTLVIHNFVNGICTVCDIKETEVTSDTINGSQNTTAPQANSMILNFAVIQSQMEATQDLENTEEATEAIQLAYPTLSFEDEVFYNIYASLANLDEEPVEMGLLVFDSLMEDGTVQDALSILPGGKAVNGLYVFRSEGVAAKDLADNLYFKVYAQMADGRYVYSKAADYSAFDYAQTVLKGDYSTEMKNLVVAMMNYAAAAQGFFGKLSFLGDVFGDLLSSITDYSADLLDDVVKVDTAKEGSFAATSTGFTRKYPTVSFEGAFSINYYFTPSTTVQGNMTLYYWNAEDYAAAETLTSQNATGSVVMTPGTSYSAAVEDIAAKDLDSTVYVAAVYNSNGITYSSGVLAYSLASYCESQAAAGSDASAFAKATAVYGYYAKQLFAK